MLQEDYIGLQNHFICAEDDYLSQREMKCETDNAMYSLQPSTNDYRHQRTSHSEYIKNHINFPVTRNSIVKICNLPCSSKENMRSR